MKCNNINCPYFLKPDKRDFVEKVIGVTAKVGLCKYGYCKLYNKAQERHK